MSRMRQALKNLEARFPSASPVSPLPSSLPVGPALTLTLPEPTPSSKPVYGGPLQALVDSSCAHLVVQPMIAESVRVALAQPASRPAQPSLQDYLQHRTILRPEVVETTLPPVPPPTASAAVLTASAPQVSDADAPAWKLNSPRAELTALEQTIQRLLADPRFADAYGELADRLEQDFAHRNVSSFALAAIESWRGQAELALGIAGMLAERGGDVLLIDGGGAGSSLSFELGHARSAGLSQWLAAPSSWSKWIKPTGLRNLYFLPAGTGDLPTDPEWSQTLLSLRGTFRQVMIDAIEAPPARVELLTRAAAATYLTVPLGLAETLPAQQTLTRLRSHGARVLGCIAAQASGS